MAKRDYYEILGISKSAAADEIKRAYRKLAMEHHPDKHGGDDAKFKEINEAHEVLRDPQKKAAYDQYGHAAGASNAGGPFNGNAGGANPFGGGFGGFGGQGVEFDLGDIFNQFMGGSGSGGSARQEIRGQDLETSMVLDFEEAIFGTERKLNLRVDEQCDRCDGKGAEPGTKINKCSTCDGAGQVTRVQQTILGAIRQTSTCRTCRGTGETHEKDCNKCGGKGVLKIDREVTIKVPAGIDDGSTIRLGGRGGAHRKGVKGDLYIHIRVKSHPRLRRLGQDISSNITIQMADAALGAEVPVETVDGKVMLKIPAGTQNNKVFKLNERGVPGIQGRKRGDHLVTVLVEIPTKLTERQKELLQEFSTASGKKHFWQK